MGAQNFNFDPKFPQDWGFSSQISHFLRTIFRQKRKLSANPPAVTKPLNRAPYLDDLMCGEMRLIMSDYI